MVVDSDFFSVGFSYKIFQHNKILYESRRDWVTKDVTRLKAHTGPLNQSPVVVKLDLPTPTSPNDQHCG